MHELSVAAAILDTAERHAGGRRVTAVALRVGELRQVIPETLAFYWEIVARGTLCEGARLDQEVVAARLRCARCGAEWEMAEADFRCAACGTAAEVVAGQELQVESIDVEEGASCTAPA
jgi:hydrogenase nickel incorporation protein HypA/HybF